jgi:hypothetical protein
LTKVAVDTSIIIEYVDSKGEFHEQAETLFSVLLAGKLEAVLPHPILVETYYVATRLYRELKVENPDVTASRLVEWLSRLPTVIIPNETIELAVETGKAKLGYGLALTDCYVLAASRMLGCKALFKKPEKEMLENLDSLKRDYTLLFLEDYL